MACSNASAVLAALSHPSPLPVPFTLHGYYTLLVQLRTAFPAGDGCILGLTPSGVWGMTMEGARTIAGSPAGFLTTFAFSWYPVDMAFRRSLTWKLPVWQVIMEMARPPHGIEIEIFSLAHLTGDPICTIASLIFTLAVAHRRLRRVQQGNRRATKTNQELVLVITAWEECGEWEKAARLEEDQSHVDSKWTLQDRRTAHALAADRTTRILPVMTAVGVFLVSIFFSIGKLYLEPWDSENPKHIDMYNIAFSMTLLPCLPIVLLAAAVGVPQSHLSVRRILDESKEKAKKAERRLRTFHALEAAIHALGQGLEWSDYGAPRDSWKAELQALTTKCKDLGSCLKEAAEDNNPSDSEHLNETDVWTCIPHGLIPSWRYDRWRWNALHDATLENQTSKLSSQSRQHVTRTLWRRELDAIILTILGSMGAITLSSQVLPRCWNNCRINGEMAICVTYLLSYAVGVVLNKCVSSVKVLLRLTMAKDLVSTAIVGAVIIMTVLGSLNQPVCWATCDSKFIAFPEETRGELQEMILSTHLVIYSVTVFMLLLLWSVVVFLLWDGISVYLQTDDGTERWVLMRRMRDWFRSLTRSRQPKVDSIEIPQEKTAKEETTEEFIENVEEQKS